MRPMMFVAAMLCAPLLALPLSAVRAQTGDTTSGPALTMDEAMRLAIQNNPSHLSVVDARRNATAAKRSAWGAMLPSANASFGTSYQQSGNIPLSGNLFNVGSDIYQSSYWLGLTYTLNAATFINPRMQSANVRAADADIAGSAETVRSTVAQDYLTVLQDRAKAVLQDTLVSQADIQLQLAQAKLAVGSGTQLDVTKAQVNLGQARVALLQAKNQVEIDKLKLFQEMGVPEPANVELTSTFEVKAPSFTVDSVLAIAREENPALRALESRDKVASLGVSQARSAYLPTLQLSTGLGGYTYEYSNANVLVQGAQFQAQSGLAQCATTDSVRLRVGMPLLGTSCTSNYQFNNTIANQIRAQNNQFPFNFTRQPLQINASLSLPLFDGFQREQRIEQAEATRNDARYKVKAQQLQLTADVTGAYLNLTTAARTVTLQEQNATQARQELALAQEKYRVGAATFLDLSDAQATFQTAENDRINAVYAFHKAFAALESAVGRPLR